MPLDRSTLDRILRRASQLDEERSVGVFFKFKEGTYTIRLLEIPGSQDVLWQSYAEHNYPGRDLGVCTCARTIGEDFCLLCAIQESLGRSENLDPEGSRLLADMNTGKTKYAMLALIHSPSTDSWVGPTILRLREDMFSRFIPYLNYREWGDPTAHNFRIRVAARATKYRGREIFDLDSVTPEREDTPIPVDLSKLRKVDVLSVLRPPDVVDIWEKLTSKTELAYYLKGLDVTDFLPGSNTKQSSESQKVATSPSPSVSTLASAQQMDTKDAIPRCYNKGLKDNSDGSPCLDCSYFQECDSSPSQRSAEPSPKPEVAEKPPIQQSAVQQATTEQVPAASSKPKTAAELLAEANRRRLARSK